MAGKLDSIAHAVAIAKIGEAAKHESDVWRHLDEIVKGAAFKGSPRSQAFLNHVVEKALHGDSADLRERSIGIALFERPAAYDTADDAIVRVTASDVRKRLLQHYANIGAESKIRIGLPPGSYVPEFSFSLPSTHSPRESSMTVAPLGNPGVAERPAANIRFGWRTAASIAIVILLFAGASWWTIRWRLGYSASKENLIKAAFQGPPSPTQVVVADDALVLIQVLLDHRFTLQEYENLTYLQVPELVQQKDLQRFWASLSSRQITNAGDLQNTNRIVADLRARNWDVTIRLARQMHARAFRNGNFVILGSSFSNPLGGIVSGRGFKFPL
jgi:hypothetical protein